MSLQVKLNGEPRELPDGSTIAQAVAELTAAPGPASPPPSTATSYAQAPGPPPPRFRDGDQVEVVTAVQGG